MANPRRAASAVTLVTSLVLSACDGTPEGLRTWRPEDHRHQSEASAPGSPQPNDPPSAPSGAPAGPRGAMPDLSASGITPVIMATWSKQCARCHGQVGRGDGPMGASLRVPDFSNPAVLASATAESLAATIKGGKGSMPAFDLPDATISGLANLVLMMGGKAKVPAPPPGAPGSAPTPQGPGSGTPPGPPASGGVPAPSGTP